MARAERMPGLARVLLTLAATATLPAVASGLTPMIDAHAHYTAEDAQALTAESIMAKLDAAGVSQLVVSGAPPDRAQELYRHAQERVIPLLGLYDTEAGKTDWMRDGRLPALTAARLDSGCWAGLGELHLFAPDADSAVFAELVRMAAAHRLVLLLHADAEVVDKAFELAPGIRVLWAHLGTRPDPRLLASMLQRHPDRLWIDTSVRDERIAPNGKLLPEWRALFLRHPDRFLAAVDTFSLNRWQGYASTVRQIRTWTNSLPIETRRRLLHDNAAQLFGEFADRPCRRAHAG